MNSSFIIKKCYFIINFCIIFLSQKSEVMKKLNKKNSKDWNRENIKVIKNEKKIKLGNIFKKQKNRFFLL